MDIEGTYTLQATPGEVWQCLMDPQALREAIPGIERLEALDDFTYEIALHMKYAPLTDLYRGRVRIVEQQYPTCYRIAIESDGRQSSTTCEASVQLSDREGNTIISYTCSLHPGKPGALLPTPYIRGASKLFLQQFFSALADYVRSLHPVPVGELDTFTLPMNPLEAQTEAQEDGGTEAVKQPTILYRLVHLLRLGRGDPHAEEQWVLRARQAGMVCGLLALVWVGTRLPRRTRV
jgi:carbon monoxide dehydrogenase subunit G